MIVVSPWSKGGYVCSETFDHTSVIRFMEKRFGVQEPNISPWRRAVCGDLTSAFDFTRSDASPAALPSTAGYIPPDHDTHPSYHPVPPATGALPKQEAGAKPARALGYVPYVDGRATVSTGKFTLTFASGPTLGAHFHSTSGNRTDGPWPYTVEAGKTLSDTWSTSSSTGNKIDLTVWGPNGFLRTWRGPAKKAGPEVTVRHDGATGHLLLTLANSGSAAVNLTVTNAYGGAAEVLRVAAGATVSHTVDPAASGRWYDVKVVSDADTSFLRRFAGHVETGAPSVSDPALRTV